MPTLISGSTGVNKITDGTIVDADVTDVAASKLTGTIADARFPSTLPAASAANLTAIPAANITGTLPAISGANLTGITTGKVLQAVQFSYGGTATTYSVDTGFVDTPLTVDITPSSTSSKVLVMLYIGKVSCATVNRTTNFKLVRESTDLSVGNAQGNRLRVSFASTLESNTEGTRSAAMSYLDSPSSTSALTYKLMWAGHNGEQHTFNYAGNSDSTDAPHSRAASNIIVMEIGA